MLSISADWETLTDASPEERACFAAVGIRSGDIWLSEGHDPFVRRVRQAPLLSGYHLAEWLTWNWWRLRWEPRSSKPDWGFAHRMATIGAGYVWPNLTIFSDGEWIAILAKPSREQEEVGYRYIADTTVIVSASDFEAAIERFVNQVAGQLAAEGQQTSNLDRLRGDLAHERRDDSLTRFRKLEALLGYDPDDAPAGEVEQLLADGQVVGMSAASELAAASNGQPGVITLAELNELARTRGFEARACDAFRFEKHDDVAWSRTPAWLIGQQIAQKIRVELGLGYDPLDDIHLMELAAVEAGVLNDPSSAPLSFSLQMPPHGERIVLRSRGRTSRRYELARLIGDRLAVPEESRLQPVTRSFTYRQKLQRAFAAELLSPFAAVDAMMEGDYSDEQQQDVAQHFEVSPLVVRTLLVNHHRIERNDLDSDIDASIRRVAA